MTPLETAVRARLRESMRATLGGQALERFVEDKTALVLPALQELMPEDATPSLEQIHRAELEATKRAMKSMIGMMTDPLGAAALQVAQKELDAVPPTPFVDPIADEIEARLAELEGRGSQADGGEKPASQ